MFLRFKYFKNINDIKLNYNKTISSSRTITDEKNKKYL